MGLKMMEPTYRPKVDTVFHKKDVKSFMELFPYKDSGIPACIAPSITDNKGMETNSKEPCEYCKDGHPYDVGGSYARQRCKANWCRDQLKIETDTKKRKQLLYMLDLAEYMGD
jgi:hypothetical protein